MGRYSKFAFDRTIHDHCPRRAHFDAGNFVTTYGDQAHKEGWCLYKMGCKGPDTHAGCSTRHFNEIPDVWPIGIGAPCIGCTEKAIAFRIPQFEVIPIHDATPAEYYPEIVEKQGSIGPAATGMVSVIVGAAGGAVWMARKKLQSSEEYVAPMKWSAPPDPTKPSKEA